VELSAQVALVTGGGRGVGRAIAGSLAAAGAAVAVLARSRTEVESTAAQLDQGLALSGDVRDPAAIDQAVRRTEATFGAITLLVNNAGSGEAVGPTWELDPDAWWGDLDTNLRGSFLAIQAVVPGMIERGLGRVVNLASHAGLRPSPFVSAYAASKAAILSLTESLEAEAAPHGVHAFAVTPGHVRTRLVESWIATEERRRLLADVAAAPEGDLSRVADLVVFIASGRADALAGRLLHAGADAAALASDAHRIREDDLLTPRLREP
jgi:NAD(P)-dependent dehydrogenase (short-subunit alcohol dehydrogenase family)